MKWRREKIRDIAQVKNGFAFKSTEYTDNGLRVIRITNVQKGEIVDSNPQFVESQRAEEFSDYALYAGDILISLTGNVGRVGVLTNELAPAVLNQRVACVRVTSKDAYAQYLFQYLNSNRFEADAINNANGIAQLNLSSKWVENYPIPLPSLDDQIRIATVLTRAERLIAKRKESIKALDELLKSTFLEMFGDGVGTITSLGEVIEIQNGQVHPKEEPYSEMYHVGGANIESETGKLINLQKAKFENLISGKYLFTSEHILYSKIRPYLNKVAMPYFTGICSADIYPIKPKSSHMNKHFLRYILMSKQFLAYTDNNSDRANIPKINRKALVQYLFILPPLPLQNQFAAIVEKVESIKAKQIQSLAELENLYASLSQRAFKGELDLSRVEMDNNPTLHIPQPQSKGRIERICEVGD